MKRLLVVDDDPDLLAMLRLWLEQEAYAVETATDGREALDLLWRKSFDCVLLDIRMPVMDGWAVLEALQSTPVAAPVIVASAHLTAADHQRALELGATASIDKPFDTPELNELIDEVCATALDGEAAE